MDARPSLNVIRAEAVARDGQSAAQTLLDRVERPRTADLSIRTSVNLIFRTVGKRRRPCVGVSIAKVLAGLEGRGAYSKSLRFCLDVPAPLAYSFYALPYLNYSAKEYYQAMLRTHTCGELRREHVGQDVQICGWVDTTREHANLTFVMVRDRYGFVQVTVGAGVVGAEVISKEVVVLVSGRVNRRPGGTEHPQLPTGEIEVEAVSIELLGACRPLPFEIRDGLSVRDDLRPEYRFLDIRRPLMLGRLVERHRIVTQLRRSLDEMNFLEVEPPMFVKSTPEGSRDFIVPSRLYPGRFYALPQSPQLYKQILMTAGVDRYYSIPRCFRDEDPRRGRQLVHTQIDPEMSFVEEDDVFSVVEKFLRDAFANVLGVELPVPFPRFTYDEVIARWGIDKPDLRFGMELVNLSGPARAVNYDVFRRALDSGGVVKGIVAPGCASYSRKEIDGLEEFVKRYRAAGLSWIKVEEGGARASFGHHVRPHEVAALVSAAGAGVGDLVLIVADKPALVARALGELRNNLGNKLDLIQRGIYRPLEAVQKAVS